MSKLFSILLVVVLFSLVSSPALASHQNVDPVGYCSTVEVEAVSAGIYNISATGWGRYAQVYDLAAGANVVRTDFGVGSTSFTWAELVLAPGSEYQVQVSRYEETGYGYSPLNCIFVAPVPQAVTISRFEVLASAFEWDSTWEGLGYRVVNSAGRAMTAWVPAQSPGSTGGLWSYRVYPWSRIPLGTYRLMATETNGIAVVAATYDYR